jgi:type IV secretion system protein VirB5
LSIEHKSTVYKPPEVPNPLSRGQDPAYADLLFDAIKSKNFWQKVMGISCLALFAGALVLFYLSISMQQIIPVLVNVLPSGESAYLGDVKQAEFQVPEAAIFYQVRKFIVNIRTIPADPYVLNSNIIDCYSMITSSYEKIFTPNLRANNPFPLVGKIRRSVEIETALHITGNSYQVDWVETTFESGAGNPTREKMRALVTVKLITPDPSFIKDNPLGIFIEACEWTKI